MNDLKKKKLLFIFIAFLLVGIILFEPLSLILNAIPIKPPSDFPVRISAPPLLIDGNLSLAATASSGAGSSGNPWIIENYVINASTLGVDGILIQNTNEYFTLRNCIVTDADPGFSGIHLSNVIFGTVFNNTVTSNDANGVFLQDANSSTVSNNSIDYNGYGIALTDAYNDVLANNTITDNNYAGILMSLSKNSDVTENIMNGNGIDFSKDGLEYVSAQNIGTSNLVNGRPIYYFVDQTNLVPNDYVNAGQIILVSCNDSQIMHTNVSHGSVGIILRYSNNNTISNNTADYNYRSIDLTYSENNTIVNNTLDFSYDSVFVWYSTNNTVSNNTALNNTRDGIRVEFSPNCKITNNTVNYNYEAGIRLIESNYTTLIKNIANYNNLFGGICLFDTSFNTLSNNRLDGNINEGIALYGSCIDNIITNNTVNYNDVGIFLQPVFNLRCDNTTLINNTVNHNGGDGIKFRESSNNKLINNTVNHNGGNGIYIEEFSNYTTIFKNIAFNNTGVGIYLTKASHSNLTENSACNNTGDGIYLYWYCVQNTFIKNTASNNTGGGIYLNKYCDGNTLDYNNFNENSYGINFVDSIYNSLFNITADNNVGTGINLDVSHNNTITNSTACNNQGDGLVLWRAGSNTFTNNLANNNIRGFYLNDQCDNNTLTNNTANYNNLFSWSAGIQLKNSKNNTYINNTINRNSYGIYLDTVNDTKLTNNTAFNNTRGIYLRTLCFTNKLSNNTVNYNEYGIFLDDSHLNTINWTVAYGNSIECVHEEPNCEGNNTIENTDCVPFPAVPVLDPILPNPDADGIIDLNWNDVVNATTYYLYRDTSNITSVVGLTPMATVSESNYTDTLTMNDMYFYVVVASHFVGNGTHSNCENITIGIPLAYPTLDPILPNPDADGIIDINWTDVVNATTYYVYRETSNITSVAGLTPTMNVSTNTTTDTLTINGPYFYVIVASDGWANSSISNCENVTVAIPPAAPVLEPIVPSISTNGSIFLNWTVGPNATQYYVYRDTSLINSTSVLGLVPIATVVVGNYSEVLSWNGLYFYVIVGGDSYANSSISNCENTTVAIPPQAPALEPIVPSISTNGSIFLNWTDVSTATEYHIYRNSSPINSTSVLGLVPITTVFINNHTDVLTTNGPYFYVIVAANATGNSSISNCENVTVAIPFPAPALTPITPNPDVDGTITLEWSNVINATTYYVYRDTSNITSVAGLTPIKNVSTNTTTDTVTNNGPHFYVIVAGDAYANGSISNCENVTVTIPPAAPSLDIILPNPDLDGFIDLNWGGVANATIYYVYRHDAFIATVTLLTPIATVTDSNYTDYIITIDIFYYVIVAEDGYANSSISNCEDITVTPPPQTPTLDPIIPNISTNGSIFLNWTPMPITTEYHIYRNSLPINSTSVLGLVPIMTVVESNYTDNITTNGLYYYVIVAANIYGNSSPSNCENVTAVIPPQAPILDPITPNISINGSIFLNWTNVTTATLYYVFRDNNTINSTSVQGLQPIATAVVSNYTENLTWNGIYYYVVMASNATGNSSISNCEDVTVAVPPGAPVLDPITPSNSTNGTIFLNWTAISTATFYYIYRNTSSINSTSVQALQPIANISTTNYTDVITTNGIYYYVIVAANVTGNSTISNCMNVTVAITPPEPPPPSLFEFFLLLLFIIMIGVIAAGVGTILVVRSMRKRAATKKPKVVIKKSKYRDDHVQQLKLKSIEDQLGLEWSYFELIHDPKAPDNTVNLETKEIIVKDMDLFIVARLRLLAELNTDPQILRPRAKILGEMYGFCEKALPQFSSSFKPQSLNVFIDLYLEFFVHSLILTTLHFSSEGFEETLTQKVLKLNKDLKEHTYAPERSKVQIFIRTLVLGEILALYDIFFDINLLISSLTSKNYLLRQVYQDFRNFFSQMQGKYLDATSLDTFRTFFENLVLRYW